MVDMGENEVGIKDADCFKLIEKFICQSHSCRTHENKFFFDSLGICPKCGEELQKIRYMVPY